MLLLERYKSWVRQHPGAVEGIERSLQLLTWFPDRFSSSEYALEGINAAVGLLGLWHESIVHNGAPSNGAAHSNGRNWALWLAAVEQVATLAEIRGMQLEKAGRMNRCAACDAALLAFCESFGCLAQLLAQSTPRFS